jgi:hypothetical protein
VFKSLKVALLSLVVVPVGIAAFSATAEAGTITLHSTVGNSKYTGSIGGGEFGVTAFSGLAIPTSPARITGSNGNPGDTVFQTFCIEGGQTLSFDTSLNFSVSTSVNNSGTPITAQTAYLYTQFWNGNLNVTGFNYNYTMGSGRVASADALQVAIWYFEGQFQGSITPGSDAEDLINAANTAVASGGVWFGKGLGDVRVLVLTDSAGNVQQDVLVLLAVPLPPAALLGLALIGGLGVAGAVRRRRRTFDA